jgi:hypothetical protein
MLTLQIYKNACHLPCIFPPFKIGKMANTCQEFFHFSTWSAIHWKILLKKCFLKYFFWKISLFNYETCLNFVIMHVESRMLSNWPHKIICGVYIIDIIMLFMLIKCYQLWISISLMICGIYKIDIIVLLLLIESYQSWNFPYLWWIMFHDIIYKLLKLVVESKKRSRI